MVPSYFENEPTGLLEKNQWEIEANREYRMNSDLSSFYASFPAGTVHFKDALDCGGGTVLLINVACQGDEEMLKEILVSEKFNVLLTEFSKLLFDGGAGHVGLRLEAQITESTLVEQ